MHQVAPSTAIRTNAAFEASYVTKVRGLLARPPVNRGAAHAMKDDTTASTHELNYVSEAFSVDPVIKFWQAMVKPNLPWAEDHFQERISGEPLNPAPSEQWWPFARDGNAEHKKDEKFSHTYPERFWPKHAEKPRYYDGGWFQDRNVGIRFPYGDLNDLIEVLRQNPMSRQAYLPIWFPEDLVAARDGERVPCSMGYHLMMVDGRLDCAYTLRSCDIVRFYRDDVYMAGRLLQHVGQQLDVAIGKLVINIDNLHCFPGDRPMLEHMLPTGETQDPRVSYNFGALM